MTARAVFSKPRNIGVFSKTGVKKYDLKRLTSHIIKGRPFYFTDVYLTSLLGRKTTFQSVSKAHKRELYRSAVSTRDRNCE